jgi:hypothetical protein
MNPQFALITENPNSGKKAKGKEKEGKYTCIPFEKKSIVVDITEEEKLSIEELPAAGAGEHKKAKRSPVQALRDSLSACKKKTAFTDLLKSINAVNHVVAHIPTTGATR